MSTLHEHIRLTALSLQDGQTMQNTICPTCNGGESGDPSLAITRQANRLAYICYRDSCATAGYVYEVGSRGEVEQARTKEMRKAKPYDGKILLLDRVDFQYFMARFGIPAHAVGRFIKIGDHDNYLLPIFNPQGRIVGHTIRQPVWKGEPKAPRGEAFPGPKALIRLKEPTEAISFYRGVDSDCELYSGDKFKWILVEDQISAIKLAACGYNAVALLSTNVNLAKVRMIQEAGADRIIIALDADATKTAFKIARDYGLAFEKAKVVIMSQDVKDTPADEFYNLFGN